MTNTIEQKQNEIRMLFSSLSSVEEKYQKIIELGKMQPQLDSSDKIPENIVQGCQSTLYLVTCFTDGKVHFQTQADALISSGLGVLLERVYSGEVPEVILKCLPTYLEELGIAQSLTPSRANGLASIYLRMKQEALKCFMLVHS